MALASFSDSTTVCRFCPNTSTLYSNGIQIAIKDYQGLTNPSNLQKCSPVFDFVPPVVCTCVHVSSAGLPTSLFLASANRGLYHCRYIFHPRGSSLLLAEGLSC